MNLYLNVLLGGEVRSEEADGWGCDLDTYTVSVSQVAALSVSCAF